MLRSYLDINSEASSPNVTLVHLRDFYRRSADIIIPTDNTKVYLPDHAWTETFAEGLQKCGLADASVLEVGVGSGINMAGLMLVPHPPRSFIGTDIADDAVTASGQVSKANRIGATLLQSDLLGALDDKTLKGVDHIIGCIPQVPRHKGEMHEDRELSDYYEETGIKEDAFGLGLVARLLDQVAERAPHTTVTLNIAGRPGEERIRDLFADRSMEPRTLHCRVVRQDAGTCLASLAEIEEQTGQDFHFFKDAGGNQEINAREAEPLRSAGVPVYHNLYVLQARL
jgi:methylase of polypeptide subunit release factors